MSLIPAFLARGAIGGNEIAVFTAMGMCYSGFLSTYSAIFDTLKLRAYTSRAILAQVIGGIAAGIVAHYIYVSLNLMRSL